MTWAVEVYATHKKVRIIRQLLSRDKEEVMAENNVRKKKKRKNTTTGLVLPLLLRLQAELSNYLRCLLLQHIQYKFPFH